MLIPLLLAAASHAEPVAEIHSVADGRPALVSFWASWCQPCRSELPRLNAMQQRLDENRVAVLTVNIDRSSRAGRAVAERLNLTLPVLWDPEGDIAKQFDPPALPATYLVDASGEVVAEWLGELDEAEVLQAEARLNALVASR